jgi:hypothetical protein
MANASAPVHIHQQRAFEETTARRCSQAHLLSRPIILHTAVFKSVPHRDPKQARLGITVFTELSDMSNPLRLRVANRGAPHKSYLQDSDNRR